MVQQIEAIRQENDEKGEFLRLRAYHLKAIIHVLALRAREIDLNGMASTYRRKRFRSDPEAKKQVFERTGKRQQ